MAATESDGFSERKIAARTVATPTTRPSGSGHLAA